MKVCLIRPQEAISSESASCNKPMLPLGIAYLASSLIAANHDVQIIDAIGAEPNQYTAYHKQNIRLLGLNQDNIIKRIDPDVGLIGISIMFSYNWPHIRQLLKDIKQKFSRVPLAIGGEVATSMSEICFQESPIDICAQGEGEETLIELANVLSLGHDDSLLGAVEGIIYRRGYRIEKNVRRNRIADVDQIPRPAWHLFNVQAYQENHFESGLRFDDAGAVIPMLATRGCPYSCTFCTSPNMWTTRYFTRNPKRVVDELEYNKQCLGATNFPFHDLTAIIHKHWIIEFCNEIIHRNLNIHWQLPSGTRTEVIDDEVSNLLYQSGMKQMAYAAESGSDAMRKHIKKKIKRENLSIFVQ